MCEHHTRIEYYSIVLRDFTCCHVKNHELATSTCTVLLARTPFFSCGSLPVRFRSLGVHLNVASTQEFYNVRHVPLLIAFIWHNHNRDPRHVYVNQVICACVRVRELKTKQHYRLKSVTTDRFLAFASQCHSSFTTLDGFENHVHVHFTPVSIFS